jgi:hypothetical protein
MIPRVYSSGYSQGILRFRCGNRLGSCWPLHSCVLNFIADGDYSGANNASLQKRPHASLILCWDGVDVYIAYVDREYPSLRKSEPHIRYQILQYSHDAVRSLAAEVGLSCNSSTPQCTALLLDIN